MLRKIVGTSLMLALCSPLLAQQKDTTPRADDQPAKRQQAIRDSVEPLRTLAVALITSVEQTHIAACLLLGNQEEVIIGEFASDRASSDEVKAFARMMVKQHGQMVAKIEQMLPAQILARLKLKPASESGTETAQSTTRKRPYTVMRPAEEVAEGVVPRPLLDLQARAAQNRIAIVESELGKFKGKDFDKRYMGCQVGAHINMLAALRAAEPAATGQLKQTIKDAEETTKQHLAEATKIMDTLW